MFPRNLSSLLCFGRLDYPQKASTVGLPSRPGNGWSSVQRWMCSPSIETLTLTGPGFRSAQASALHSNWWRVSVSSLSLERRWVAQPPPLLWNSLKRALSAQPDEVWASPQDGSSRARPKAAVSTPSPEAAHCLEPFLLSGPGCLAQLSSMVLWLGWAGLSASSRVESQETREKMTGMK